MKLLIAEANEFNPSAISLLAKKFDVLRADLDREQLLEALTDVEILWVRLRTMIDVEVMTAAPRLTTIVTNTTGLTHIDLEEANRRGITILSLKGENDFLKDIRATAEHTIALTLALLRKLPAAHIDVMAGHWNRYRFKGSEIYGKTVGIIGFGRLGCITANYFHSFGAQVLAYDIRREAERNIEQTSHARRVSLDTLLCESDIVTLHASYNGGNRRMIASDAFRRMKQGAIFINTARGELIDEAALVRALSDEHLAGAALDVLDAEHQLGDDHSLRNRALHNYAQTHENLILTPHIGGNTVESSEKTELFMAKRLLEHWESRQSLQP